MNAETPIVVTAHDACPPEAARVIDTDLGDYNDAAAPLHEVRPISAVARDATGAVLGGAIGRRWGPCCELRQLWVHEDLRGTGLGTRIAQQFERHAAAHGCTVVLLETLSFQAPEFYKRLGYRIEHERTMYPHGITKVFMTKTLAPAA
ncbi:MAG: GNAT family N-acetyltransferase [Betaproteobacteria bacterium]